MHKTIITAAICALALLSSCASLQTRTGHTKEVQGAIVHQPVLADLNVRNTKVTGTATASTGNSLDAVKNLALKEALTSAKADLLVEPTYEVQRNGSNTTVTITGFPATYMDFRTATTQDIALMDAGSRYMTSTAKAELAPEKKKGTGVFVAVAVAVAVVLGLLVAGG